MNDQTTKLPPLLAAEFAKVRDADKEYVSNAHDDGFPHIFECCGRQDGYGHATDCPRAIRLQALAELEKAVAEFIAAERKSEADDIKGVLKELAPELGRLGVLT